MSQKYVYFFGSGEVEGSASMRDLLGGKGANLAEMTSIGIPVPPGFTISTDVCAQYYENNKQYPSGLSEEVDQQLAKLEKMMGKTLGDPSDPLLVSVRSGAAVSMPGMMDTVLNLGMNDMAVEGLSRKTANDRLAWDAYRRFIQMFGNVVMSLDIEHFEEKLSELKSSKGVSEDTDLTAADLKQLVSEYKAVFNKLTGKDFPQDPKEQLWASINAVFGSWNNDKAIKYRTINNIKDVRGTAVNVQSMVFGNFGEDSGTGVCFSRDPATGEKIFYGEYLINAQGEDVVAGIRTPLKISRLEEDNARIYKELVGIKDNLEKHYKDMQDMEFTIQQGKLYVLQTRNGKRTGKAAVKCAIDMVHEGLITKEEAVGRVSPNQIDQILHPMIQDNARKNAKCLAKGLNASPGAASGQVVFTADEAETWVGEGKHVILVRKETSPEDIGGMNVAEGILTSTGGLTSHAAVVARGMGKPSIVGCKDISISGNSFSASGTEFSEGDWITLDGGTGEVFAGELALSQPEFTSDLTEFLGWVDVIRHSAVRTGLETKGFLVRTNADTPEDSKKAREFGAEGIGLCRTEHMFFEKGKIEFFREMIVAEDIAARKKGLAKLLPLQQADFDGIFEAMDGLPVTIRLLDPPLHEFVHMNSDEVAELAGIIGIDKKKLEDKIESLSEQNPMLGHRGCRLGITYPEIYDMQVEAIIKAACAVSKRGLKVLPEIMIPLVGIETELSVLRGNAEKIVKQVLADENIDIDYMIGTMIEVPRAALTADKIAENADFFSFGTNDLTQMTWGYSRDDVGAFVPEYLEQGIIGTDPFKALDQEGVGQLVALGVEKGRSVNRNLKVGICGEHGGEPSSIEFCYRTGLNYVSCSPYRVPIARLAAAQSVLKNK
jgi:pyruvate, orthophosphate dikinase